MSRGAGVVATSRNRCRAERGELSNGPERCRLGGEDTGRLRFRLDGDMPPSEAERSRAVERVPPLSDTRCLDGVEVSLWAAVARSPKRAAYCPLAVDRAHRLGDGQWLSA